MVADALSCISNCEFNTLVVSMLSNELLQKIEAFQPIGNSLQAIITLGLITSFVERAG